MCLLFPSLAVNLKTNLSLACIIINQHITITVYFLLGRVAVKLLKQCNLKNIFSYFIYKEYDISLTMSLSCIYVPVLPEGVKLFAFHSLYQPFPQS